MAKKDNEVNSTDGYQNWCNACLVLGPIRIKWCRIFAKNLTFEGEEVVLTQHVRLKQLSDGGSDRDGEPLGLVEAHLELGGLSRVVEVDRHQGRSARLGSERR